MTSQFCSISRIMPTMPYQNVKFSYTKPNGHLRRMDKSPLNRLERNVYLFLIVGFKFTESLLVAMESSWNGVKRKLVSLNKRLKLKSCNSVAYNNLTNSILLPSIGLRRRLTNGWRKMTLSGNKGPKMIGTNLRAKIPNFFMHVHSNNEDAIVLIPLISCPTKMEAVFHDCFT